MPQKVSSSATPFNLKHPLHERLKGHQGIDKFPLQTEPFKNAIEFLNENMDELCKMKGKSVNGKEDFAHFIAPLLKLEKQAGKDPKTAWRIVIDNPQNEGIYIDNWSIQLCNGPPSYDRIVLTFSEKGCNVKLVTDTICAKPNLRNIHSSRSPDRLPISLSKLKKYNDKAGIQAFAILGSARVFPYTENSEWHKAYTKHVQHQLGIFLKYLQDNKIIFTTINGGWAGIKEGSMGVPMMSSLFGITHESDSRNIFPPITIMPSAGAFDRVVTRADDLYKQDSVRSVHTYFEVPGVWGDDSRYLVGFSTGLLVFEPYGYWTNIEVANALAQDKPVAVIADPDLTHQSGHQYQKAFNEERRAYIEKTIKIPPHGIKKSYRVYKNADDAAEWLNNEHKLFLEKEKGLGKEADIKQRAAHTKQRQNSPKEGKAPRSSPRKT